MTWSLFPWFALSAVLLWAAGSICAARGNRFVLACGLTVGGLLVFLTFLLGWWATLDRPPLRTMGETRLWYSFFLPLVALVVYARRKYRLMPAFGCLLSLVFIGINLLHPEQHDKVLPPALQSPWFAPHVILYMFAYALLGAAAVLAVYRLLCRPARADAAASGLTDDLAAAGTAFLTFGMLTGALWAKAAWGHYWSWDPKETWAALTWFAYLLHLHLRRSRPRAQRAACGLLLLGFALLQVCWWGIHYLPSAQGSSLHTYALQ